MPTFQSNDPNIPAVDGEHTTNGTALVGNSAQGFGVHGVNDAPQGSTNKADSGVGVWGESSRGYGVFGSSDHNIAIKGVSINNEGVQGESDTRNGVFGVSHSSVAGMAGVAGVNKQGGIGVWGGSQGGGVGVQGESDSGNGVLGLSHGSNAAVSAVNDAGGLGLWVESRNGDHQAANFVGQVKIEEGGITVNASDGSIAAVWGTGVTGVRGETVPGLLLDGGGAANGVVGLSHYPTAAVS
ncbi:MAG TPA: hypothetical protein VFU48_16400, partial [Nitrospira sp.]|nr:hypothetical protein [Nitrospira sp.]